MEKRSIAAVVLALGASTAANAAAWPNLGVIFVPGYVAHGVNVFNDKPIADYSHESGVESFNADPLPKEVGVLDSSADATNAAVITEDTDRSLPLETIQSSIAADL